MGHARAAGLVAVVAAMALAGPVLTLGGYSAVGAASVLACLLAAATATRLPEQPPPATRSGSWTTTLRAGLAEARADRSVRTALLLVPAVGAVWGALDEYTPLLVQGTGVAEHTVPYLLLMIWATTTTGSLLAGACSRLSQNGLAVLLAGAALALAAGATLRTPAGLLLVAIAFAGFQLATVLADARLQARIDDQRRATLTSLASLGTDIATVVVYAAYTAVTSATSHHAAFAWAALPYLVTALLITGGRRTPTK
jgi:predicted MFS family arabinose efflux permease